MPSFLPYGRQCIEDDDIAAVSAVLKSDWLTTGPTVQQFEAAFAAQVQVPHAIACCNGTAALHLAALALGLGPGDWVVVPTITFLATANAARYVGAEVKFADVDPETGLLTEASFAVAADRVPGKVRAVFPVHLGGQCADVAAIAAQAQSRGMQIVEDGCHALGTLHADNGPPVGSCVQSDLACFSFHPVKTIAMGEGGMVTTKDPMLAERVSRLRTHGMTRDPVRFRNTELAYAADSKANPWYYEMVEPGFNYRASDINCALGLSQLHKLERFAARRRELVAAYDRALAPLAPVVKPVRRVLGCKPVWHLYSVLIDFNAIALSRASLMDLLRERGIGTQVHYIPVHLQPYYRERYGLENLPGADAYYGRQLSLPLFVGMNEEDVVRVVEALSDIIEGRR